MLKVNSFDDFNKSILFFKTDCADYLDDSHITDLYINEPDLRWV